MEEFTAYLIVERGPQPDQQFSLLGEELTIGRSAANEIVIVDPEISRRHARIVHHDDQFALEDLGSTNGTFLNGHRITHLTSLQDGDLLDLGDSVSLRFTTLSGPAAVAGAAAVATSPDADYRPPFAPPPPPRAESFAAWEEPEQEVEDFVYYATAEAAAAEDYQAPYQAEDPAYAFQPLPAAAGRRPWVGCLLALLAITLICVGTFIFLDAFDQGRLLYCGPARPIFELLLRPFGFAPLC